MIQTLDDPFYYLANFETVLAWITERYADLLSDDERDFIAHFAVLPKASRALMVRMVMRKGELFRASKLNYEEIGDTREAARPLAALGWIDDDPLLTLEQLFGLLRKPEIVQIFSLGSPEANARKAEQLQALCDRFPEPRRFAAWWAHAHDCAADIVYQVRITGLCDRLRLMFFGNLYQDWSEFVLSDLGIFTYEKVEFSASSRGFQTRRDVDDYLHLHRCRERLQQDEAVADILEDVRAQVPENAWIASRRRKFLFQLGQYYEQLKDWPGALGVYAECAYPGARIRRIRVMEKHGQLESAFELANSAERAPENEAEQQQLLRIMPRLRRKLALPKLSAVETAPAQLLEIALTLPKPTLPFYVEDVARAHLEQAQQPVHYVENTLINSLFGLLCWNAIFAAVPGAFFHPFHQGPADLHSADFQLRRAREFEGCLSQLDSEQYRHSIRSTFRQKSGIQSPFVFWEILSEELLELALACIPAQHLKKCFERILLDIQSNRSGLPDLIQFWPQEKRYRMIEVKGPGDRLQDNQIRWLDYCAAHDIPVAVCYVQWVERVN